jgi:hypothetical protein
MKAILAMATAALMMGSAYAQTGSLASMAPTSSSGTRHMFEFNADSVLRGVFSFDKSKTTGQNADNGIALDLSLNYAYSLPSMPRLQLGGRLNYLKDTNSAGDIENYGFMVGGIWNSTSDLQNSIYASLYLGMGWDHEYGSGGKNDELLTSILALGKRYSMEPWGIKHLTYTPEIALFNQNSTTGGSFEYTQSIQFRVLQFSVFF